MEVDHETYAAEVKREPHAHADKEGQMFDYAGYVGSSTYTVSSSTLIL